jgi:hypothetical protein
MLYHICSSNMSNIVPLGIYYMHQITGTDLISTLNWYDPWPAFMCSVFYNVLQTVIHDSVTMFEQMWYCNLLSQWSFCELFSADILLLWIRVLMTFEKGSVLNFFEYLWPFVWLNLTCGTKLKIFLYCIVISDSRLLHLSTFVCVDEDRFCQFHRLEKLSLC